MSKEEKEIHLNGNAFPRHTSNDHNGAGQSNEEVHDNVPLLTASAEQTVFTNFVFIYL